MTGTDGSHARAGRIRWVLELTPMSRASLGAVWITYAVVFYLGLVAGVYLAPLSLIPVAATAFGRRLTWGVGAGLMSVPIHLGLGELADSHAAAWSLIVGTVVLTILGAGASFASQLLGHLVSETATARRAQAQADEVREVYRSLYEGVPVGLWRTRPDGTVVEVNQAFCGFFGFTEEEILAMHAADMYMDPAERESRIDLLVAGGVLRGAVLQLRHKDGRPVFVRTNTQTVRDADGGILYFDGVGVDVTAEVLSEKRRLVSDALFRSAFESSPIGMAIATEDWKIVQASAALERFLGYGRGELDGVMVDSISVADDMDLNRRARKEAADRGDSMYSMRKRYRRKDGEIVDAFLTAAWVPGTEPKMLVAYVVDMADQVRAQHALEELVRSKDEFLATVSHEIRTPLTVVHGMAHELHDGWGAFTSEERYELAGLIAEQSTELVFLVEDLLVVARADAGTLEVKRESVDLSKEIEAVLASVPHAVAEMVSVDCGDAVVIGDRLRVRQILRNLLTNAHRYGGDKVRVVAELTEPVDRCAIQVRDNGSGVPEELANTIFEPYQRAHSLGIVTEAVGLGLTVSRTLAQMMGGSLEYRREDDWSVFEMTLLIEETVGG